MRILCLTLLALFFSGCGPAVSEAYRKTAQYRYEVGQDAFESGNYLEAVTHYSRVKTKFPYSKFAALAELRIGDAYFEQDKFVEAIDVYQTFVRRRPKHPKLAYAFWRIAEGHFEQMPADFFLFPPSFERDRIYTKDALGAYVQYLSRFPDGKYAKNAGAKRKFCRAKLGDYELYVARFYLKDDRPMSAMGRLEMVHDRFRDIPGHWIEGSLELLNVYRLLSQPDAKGEIRLLDAMERARGVAQAIIDGKPGGRAAREATKYLAALNKGVDPEAVEVYRAKPMAKPPKFKAPKKAKDSQSQVIKGAIEESKKN